MRFNVLKDKMSMEDVCKLLKKNKGKWFSAKEIAEKLKLNQRNVSVALHKLQKYDEDIEIIKRSSFVGGNLWRIK